MEATQTAEGDSSMIGVSASAALADMFPKDVAPLIDVSGKKWVHTVWPLPLSCHFYDLKFGTHACKGLVYLSWC